MTWKIFAIKGVFACDRCISFNLFENVEFCDGNTNWIDCKNCHPFNSWKVANRIEIDCCRTRYESRWEKFDSNVVREATLNTATSLIPSTASSSLLSLASESFRYGWAEFEHKIEDRNGGHEKIVYWRGSWRYEKTSFGN